MNDNPLEKPVNRLLAVLVAVFVLAVLFSGCASGTFENRIVCTTDGKRAQVVSRWGGFGIASDLHEVDALAICKGQGAKL